MFDRPALLVLAASLTLGVPTAVADGKAFDLTKLGFDSGLPTMQTPMKVVDVTERGPYLEAHLEFGTRELWSYAAPSDVCRSVFLVDQEVRYVDNGPLGVFRRGEEDCQVFGIANLRIWRDRNSRAFVGEVVPRAQATYRTMYRDDQLVLLRGNFPLASQLGFAGTIDMIAVVPVGGECAGPIAKGVSSLEYRAKGKRVLSLIGKSGLCDLVGLIQPLPQGVRTHSG